MINSKMFVLTVTSSLLMAGCGGETQRSTEGSSNLSGLWRMGLEASRSGLEAISNSSFILTDSVNGLVMTDCLSRNTSEIIRSDRDIIGLPISPIKIEDYDTLSADNDFSTTHSSKMAVTTKFDMGDLTLNSSEFGDLSFSDVCVISSEAKVLGVLANENIMATTTHKGNLLLIDISVMGKLKPGDFSISKEPGAGEVSIRLQSESFKDSLNRTEVLLASGVMTVTEKGLVWTKGTFNGTLSNGKAISGGFSFENP